MFVRIVAALLGLIGALHVLSRLGEGGADPLTMLPGTAIGLLVCAPFLVYGLLGAERFARLLPPLAFLVEDPAGEDEQDRAEG
jgi:hypothetical protein